MVSLMKGSARSLGLLLPSLLALCACGEVSNEQSESATEELRLDPCEETTASYETVGEPFMRTWCTSCHHSQLEGADRPAGSEGVNLDSFERVLQHLDRIEARALSATPTMPPAGGPSAEALERLSLWIECGAVESTATGF